MSIGYHNLDALFAPRSVAVIGASDRPGSLGTFVMANLISGGFDGPLLPVNPKYASVAGIRAYGGLSDVPHVPDLAVLCTPPSTVPPLVSELAAMGTRAAVVCTAGLVFEKDERGRRLDRAMMEAVGTSGLRVLGPNCVGVLAPHAGLNASFAPATPAPGTIGFVSQSGAFCTAVLSWAAPRGIGFSAFVSLGDSVDVDFGDVIDYLASDPKTRAILLYIESVGAAREFLSATRAASRNKPVIAIKAGRITEGERAAASHTGALAGSDELHDYALRRAGVLRVERIDELFDAAEILDRMGAPSLKRLTILTNGGGPGVMATDALIRGGGELTELRPETVEQLGGVLPRTWSRGNPVDIVGDAGEGRYRDAIRILLDAPEVDAILTLHAPTAVLRADAAARALAETAGGCQERVLSSWLGAPLGPGSRELLAEAGIAAFDSPEDGVRAFVHVVEHARRRELLMRTPPADPDDIRGDRGKARSIIAEGLRDGRSWLTEIEAKEILKAYGIPVVETRLALDAAQAAALAADIGFPVALKLLSPDVLHKTDVGGVVLDLDTKEAVLRAAEGIVHRLASHRPEATVKGFAVQEMARPPGAHELHIGASVDPIFGPFLVFGAGGVAVEVIEDTAVALPPLDVLLVEDLISRTRISRLLEGFRDRPPVDRDALHTTLLRVAQMVMELPELVELDINPVLAHRDGAVALDARMRVTATGRSGEERLAIRPYPAELELEVTLPSGRQVLIRPIRPQDEESHRRLFSEFSEEDVRFRFFHLVKELPHSELARYTQIDYDREMAFIAIDRGVHERTEEVGVVRAILGPDGTTAEFAVIVASRLKGEGLGRVLVEKMIEYLRSRGVEVVMCRVLGDNVAMVRLARSVGFQTEGHTDANELEFRLALERGSGEDPGPTEVPPQALS